MALPSLSVTAKISIPHGLRDIEIWVGIKE